MINHNLERYIGIIVGLSILVCIILTIIHDNLRILSLKIFIGDISTTISVVSILCVAFISWAWKWKIFRNWLVPFPCISGKWEGTLVSTFDNEKKEIPITVSISQNFFNVQIRIKTEESTSNSTCASFDIDGNRGLKQLLYSYQNNPKATIRDRSEIHYGTARLEINDDATFLEGEYWTTRKTTGEISIHKI